MTTIRKYAEGRDLSLRTPVMLFAAGWLILAYIALPLPATGF